MPGKNEFVHYGACGVCRVEDIRPIRFGPDAPLRAYYVLHAVEQNGADIYVPADNPKLMSRMRPVPTQDEIDRLLAGVREDRLPWIEDRKVRLASFQAIVKACDLRELICLASCLYQRQRALSAAGKKLGASDENILHRTEALIENQVGFVLQVSADQVGGYIREKLAT